MSAFFFPNNNAPTSTPGFIAFSSGEKTRYVRQAVDSLDLAPLLADSKAQRSMLALREDYTAQGIPERYFSRYYREDGSDFFVGTVAPSHMTFPPSMVTK